MESIGKHRNIRKSISRLHFRKPYESTTHGIHNPRYTYRARALSPEPVKSLVKFGPADPLGGFVPFLRLDVEKTQ